MNSLFNCAVLLCFFLSSFSVFPKDPPYPDGLYAEVNTSKGLIVLQLEFEKTPMTVSNFVGLAEGTIKNSAFPSGVPYFSNSKWDRVVPGHVIQTSAPSGGQSTGPGYQFPNEIYLPTLNHGRIGMVNMANNGPHTNGSAWCITLGDRSYLDGDYTVFGHVVQGLEVLTAIVKGDEIKTIKIVRVGKAAEAFRPTTESFLKLREEALLRVAQVNAKKLIENEKIIRANWPLAREPYRSVVMTQGEGQKLAFGTKVSIQYKGTFLHDGDFVSTADGGKPWFGDMPQPFEYEIGKSSITPGFDEAVSQMRKGERRIVIVPAEQAYGAGGYYPPERKGEKRFHVSPNEILVYEVEILDVVK